MESVMMKLLRMMDMFIILVVVAVSWCMYVQHYLVWASLVAQRLKHLPAMQETWVWSLGREDSLEKEMAPHSSIVAWRIPWTEEPGGLQSTGSQRVGHDWVTSLSVGSIWNFLFCIPLEPHLYCKTEQQLLVLHDNLYHWTVSSSRKWLSSISL